MFMGHCQSKKPYNLGHSTNGRCKLFDHVIERNRFYPDLAQIIIGYEFWINVNENERSLVSILFN